MKENGIRVSLLFALLIAVLFHITAQSKTDFYLQGKNNRVAAEWEPALGTMITWPLSIPYKLAVELAKDDHLYLLVENEGIKADALKWLTKWGVDSTRTSFILMTQGVDAWWVRDWGPSAVFTPDGLLKLADGKYIYSTPMTRLSCTEPLEFLYKTPDGKVIKTETEDQATIKLGQGLKLEILDLPFINTGGNVLTDGLGTAFSSCILLNENKFYGIASDTFLQLNKNLLGFQNYHIISNFEKQGIQHIDCFMKLLDEERILVAEPPPDHELYPIYENIVQNELSKLRSPYGRPYEIIRLKTMRYDGEHLAAYTNSLILNKTIYVPLFRTSGDSIALQTYRELMPGYQVKGFEYVLATEPFISQDIADHYINYGWNQGDALHCRTRAVWDPAMLFISTKKIISPVDSKDEHPIYATIIDYSKKGLIKNQTEIVWRILGEKEWKRNKMTPLKEPTQFKGEIPYHKKGTRIEYYISAISNSGKTETQPRTAPLGAYKFSIK